MYGSPWSPHIVAGLQSWGFGVHRGAEAAQVNNARFYFQLSE